MRKPLLIIVNGLPCTGKTTLASYLGKEFHLPVISKDGIKELLFDNLGWSDRAWSRKLGMTTYPLLFYFIEAQLKAGQPCIVESNFHATFETPKFTSLKEHYDFEPFQIQCITRGDILYRRFMDRAESKERHPGHVEPDNLEEFKPFLLLGEEAPLDIGGILFKIDTTDFTAVNYQKIIAAIRAHAHFPDS